MIPISSSCISLTLDALNEAGLEGRMPDGAERKQVAQWIAGQGDVLRLAPGVWRAPEDGAAFHLFTGEAVHTQLAVANVLGLEACRALASLDMGWSAVAEALAGAGQKIAHRCYASGCVKGECAHSAVAYWRYLAETSLPDKDERLAAAMSTLAERRDGKGRWLGFPFHYTLLALLEIDTPAARAEMAYAAPGCARLLARRAADGEYARRQRAVLERVAA